MRSTYYNEFAQQLYLFGLSMHCLNKFNNAVIEYKDKNYKIPLYILLDTIQVLTWYYYTSSVVELDAPNSATEWPRSPN